MAGIATFNLNNQPNTGINIAGSIGPSNNTIQNTAPTSNQYLLSGSAPVATYQPNGSTTAPAPVAAPAGASTGVTAAPDLSSYDQSINATNAQINNLIPGLTNAIGGADANYQTTINGLTQQKANTDQQYGTAKTSNAQDFSGAKNTIRTNTGQTINGITRVLGSRGAGGQSAGDYAALLAGRAGTTQLTGAGTSFGKNEQNLDTNYNNFLTGYNTNVKNADTQHKIEVDNANADIQVKKANLLQTLATLINQKTAATGGNGVSASQPYIDQANSLLSSATALSAPRAVAPQAPVTYTPPTLSSYVTNPTAVAAAGQPGSAATDASVQPFLASLLGRDRQLQVA